MRKVEDVNADSLANKVWKTLIQPNNILVQVVKAKYFKIIEISYILKKLDHQLFGKTS